MTEPTDAGPDPCPFCGSSNVVHYEVEGHDNHHFECCNCFASSMCKTTRQEALAAWNRRTPQPTQAQAGALPLTKKELADRSKIGAIHTDERDNVVMRRAEYRDQMEGRFERGWREAEKHYGIKGADHG